MKKSFLKSISAKLQEINSSIIKYIKEDTLSFLLRFITTAFLTSIVLILNYHFSVKWWYIIVFGVALCTYIFYNILSNRNKKNEMEALQTENFSLIRDNKNFGLQVTSLTNKLKELEKQFSNSDIPSTLETDYPRILLFFQMLNITIEGLPESDIGFVNTVVMEQNMAMMTYGYKFVDYLDHETLYDTEYQPLENPKLISRAIVDKNNKLIIKGRIYLPLNYGSQQG